MLARILCAILTAVPVVAITVFMAITQLRGTTPQGPSCGLFANLGPNVSYLVPLVLVIAGTVGHALRESSAINAFLAGLVVELAVMLGYPLHLSTSSQTTVPRNGIHGLASTHDHRRRRLGNLLADRPTVGECLADEPMSGGMPTLAVGMKRANRRTHAHDKRGHGTDSSENLFRRS